MESVIHVVATNFSHVEKVVHTDIDQLVCHMDDMLSSLLEQEALSSDDDTISVMVVTNGDIRFWDWNKNRLVDADEKDFYSSDLSKPKVNQTLKDSFAASFDRQINFFWADFQNNEESHYKKFTESKDMTDPKVRLSILKEMNLARDLDFWFSDGENQWFSSRKLILKELLGIWSHSCHANIDTLVIDEARMIVSL